MLALCRQFVLVVPNTFHQLRVSHPLLDLPLLYLLRNLLEVIVARLVLSLKLSFGVFFTLSLLLRLFVYKRHHLSLLSSAQKLTPRESIRNLFECCCDLCLLKLVFCLFFLMESGYLTFQFAPKCGFYGGTNCIFRFVVELFCLYCVF